MSVSSCFLEPSIHRCLSAQLSRTKVNRKGEILSRLRMGWGGGSQNITPVLLRSEHFCSILALPWHLKDPSNKALIRLHGQP